MAPAGAGRQGLTFNRRSTVHLRGSWGEVRLGRDYTPSFWNWTIFDTFATNGVGTTQLFNSGINLVGVAGIRASNSVGYSTPGCFDPVGCVGFYGQAQVFLGENPSNAPGGTEKDGSGASLRAGYAGGPWHAAFGHGQIRYATAPGAGDVTQTNFGLSYLLGATSLKLLLARDQLKALVSVVGTGYQVGVNMPVGAGELRASWGTYKTDAAGSPKTSKLSVGYVHNLSKRTALYAAAARLGNRGGANQALNGATGVANGSSAGYDLGFKHSF